jgi:AcrR family transcriptional regulator
MPSDSTRSAIAPSDASAPDAPDASARVARRARRRERSREEILDATRRVVMRSGVSAMTLDAVAREVGVSKTALYYYFPSKDALLFELMFRELEAQARAVNDEVAGAPDGAGALGAVIAASVKSFASRIEDFRLTFLQTQLVSPGSVQLDPQQFARIRPLNDLLLAGAAAKLAKPGAAPGVEPRLLAFLAYLSAIGLLTMKGLVESLNDPLKYSDDELIEALSHVFASAAPAQ